MKHIVATSLVLSVMACSAIPAVADSRLIRAEITSVVPQYKTQTVQHPYQDCQVTYQNQTTGSSDDDITNQVIGGIIGGVIGNQFGKGNGKAVTTGAGVLMGSVIGRRHNNNYGSTTSVPVRTCVTRYNFTEEQVFMGNVVSWRTPDGTSGSFQTTRNYVQGNYVNVRVQYYVQPN